VSVFYADLNNASVDDVIKSIKAAGADIIHTTLAWSQVEPSPGKWEFGAFQRAFQQLKDEGLRFIIALDSSCRLVTPKSRIFDDRFPTRARPDWLAGRLSLDILQTDFLGRRAPDLDPFDTAHLPYLKAFYDQSLTFIRDTLKDSVFAILPGINSELEIKYGQNGFRWRSWSDAAQSKFRSLYGCDMPQIAFNNELGAYQARVIEHYRDLQNFREDALVAYLKPLCSRIREAGYKTIGYFGQTFTFMDAVYCCGIVEKCRELFDVAVADYNYYDGFKVNPNPWVIPAFVNFIRGLGYKECKLGLYVERYRNLATNDLDSARIMPTVAETLAFTESSPAVSSIEIGGIEPKDFRHIGSLLETNSFRLGTKLPSKDPDAMRIAVLANFDNHYLWHGDHTSDRDLLNDALIQTFRLLALSPRFRPDIVSARLLEQGLITLENYDVLFIPYMPVMSDELIQRLTALRARGFRLAQDAAAGIFDPDGRVRPLAELGVFGLSSMEWVTSGEGQFSYGGELVKVGSGGAQHFSYIRLSPVRGEIEMPETGRTGQGLIVKSDKMLAFGFLPQLCTSGPGKAYWESVFCRELERLARS
jgi:beta-galactosidase